jgi:choline dehydrogenase-like flavoprotein
MVTASGHHESRSYPERIGFSTLSSSSFYDGRDRVGRGAIRLEFDTEPDPVLWIQRHKRWGSDFADYNCREFGHRLRVSAETEQQPNPKSYVGLDPYTTDLFGDPVPHVHFELSDVDRKTQEKSHEMLGTLLTEVGATDIGHSKHARGPRHHMGTCRMSDDPDRGVVDRDCRVHGADNLYIAGSSVFPTSGAMQPTLTIAALALRLADHITKDSKYK